MVKIYKLYDMQDETNSWKTNLKEAQKWLIKFWCDNNDDEMSVEELDEFIVKIEKSDLGKLSEYLQGIDYDIKEIERG